MEHLFRKETKVKKLVIVMVIAAAANVNAKVKDYPVLPVMDVIEEICHQSGELNIQVCIEELTKCVAVSLTQRIRYDNERQRAFNAIVRCAISRYGN